MSADLASAAQKLVKALRSDECGHVLNSIHAANCPVCRALAELLVCVSAGESPNGRGAPTDQDVCRRCGHYRETHDANRCGGWMPAGAGHPIGSCQCEGFEGRAAATQEDQ